MKILKDDLLKYLVCPIDKGELEEVSSKSRLTCKTCGASYLIRNGIPVLLVEKKK
jgi:uncharacterized protein YbaR (Trm112 family)